MCMMTDEWGWSINIDNSTYNNNKNVDKTKK